MNLEPAYQKACAKFKQINPQIMAQNSGFPFNEEEGCYDISFLGHSYQLSYSLAQFKEKDGQILPLDYQICILHYLTDISQEKPNNEYISFKEIPNGFIYQTPFTNRCIRRLIKMFGNNKEELVRKGLKLKGVVKKIGDSAITIPVFPKIPITLVIWEGDDEFPPNGTILFDKATSVCLPIEDFVIIASIVLSVMQEMD